MGEAAPQRGSTNPRGNETGSRAVPSGNQQSLTLQARRVIAIEVAVAIVISEGSSLLFPGTCSSWGFGAPKVNCNGPIKPSRPCMADVRRQEPKIFNRTQVGEILVKASCSPDFPPIFWFPKFFFDREIYCNQDALWFSRAGAMQNTLAQQRQASRSCSFRCDLSENHRPLAKTQGMSLQTHTADPLLGVPISLPIFVPIFCSDFFCYFSAEKLQKKTQK